MTATALAPLVITIRGDSPLGRMIARVCRVEGCNPVMISAAAIDAALTIAADSPEFMERLVLESGEKSLARQLKGV